MQITIGVALGLIALLLLIWGMRLRAQTGLPWAPVRYSDAGWSAPEKPLLARSLGLVGKPDYVLEIHGSTIPVEVKPSRRATRPYDSDLMQLAAYCVLIEETSGMAPPYGLLRYAEQTFRLDYSPRLRADVLAILDEMRDLLLQSDVTRDHDDAHRCHACGFYTQCDDAIEAEDEDA
jgi:CRISPR-associated exonuclease Cas4